MKRSAPALATLALALAACRPAAWAQDPPRASIDRPVDTDAMPGMPHDAAPGMQGVDPTHGHGAAPAQGAPATGHHHAMPMRQHGATHEPAPSSAAPIRAQGHDDARSKDAPPTGAHGMPLHHGATHERAPSSAESTYAQDHSPSGSRNTPPAGHHGMAMPHHGAAHEPAAPSTTLIHARDHNAAHSKGSPPTSHHGRSMPHHGAAHEPAAPSTTPIHAQDRNTTYSEDTPPTGHHGRSMQHAGVAGAAHETAMRHAAPSMPPRAMAPMQGGEPPPDARDPDYSGGLAASPMHGMDMHDDPRLTLLRIDQLEAFHGARGDGQRWEIQGGYGTGRDRLWLRTEGERERGRLGEAAAELFWQHATAAFWNVQLGLRADLGEGPRRPWAAFGIQGLAPYWFELEATGYVGAGGRTAARFRAEYELLFTQRLVLQPELELNAYGRADPARGLGGGLSDVSLGLRLRYEIRREVAPYVGLLWTRRFGGTAGHARAAGEGASERRWVAGVRIQF